MSANTQLLNENLAKNFNAVLDDKTLFSVEATSSQKLDNVKDGLIKSVTDTRENILKSKEKFKEYYIEAYGIVEWEKFNKNPNSFNTPLFLVTGIPPNPLEKPNIPDTLGFLQPAGGEYHAAPTFYKNMYDIYLKNVQSSANYYEKISEKSPKGVIPNMDELYKILNIDLDTQIQDKINTTNVNKRKTYYERQETDKMKFIIDALRTLYIRIFLILFFIKLYVYFLKHPISIKGVFIELFTLTFLFVFPILLAIQIITIIPKYVFEYMPVNVWVKNME
jgi:hypothetical protein